MEKKAIRTLVTVGFIAAGSIGLSQKTQEPLIQIATGSTVTPIDGNPLHICHYVPEKTIDGFDKLTLVTERVGEHFTVLDPKGIYTSVNKTSVSGVPAELNTKNPTATDPFAKEGKIYGGFGVKPFDRMCPQIITNTNSLPKDISPQVMSFWQKLFAKK